jgi:hypothetical protein
MDKEDDTQESGLEVDRDTTTDIIVNKPEGDSDG